MKKRSVFQNCWVDIYDGTGDFPLRCLVKNMIEEGDLWLYAVEYENGTKGYVSQAIIEHVAVIREVKTARNPKNNVLRLIRDVKAYEQAEGPKETQTQT